MMTHSVKRPLLVSFGMVAVAVGAATYGLYYFSNDITAQTDKIVSDKTLLAQQTAAVSILARLKSDAPQAAVYAAAMDKLLPTHDGLIGFQQWLLDRGRADNVAVSFSYRGNNTPASPGNAGSDGFSLIVDGGGSAIMAFLGDIETKADAYLLSVDSFTLTSNGSSYELSIQGRVFSRPT